MESNKSEKTGNLTYRQAIEQATATGMVAVLLGSGARAITQDEADRLRAEGTSFAYLCIHEGKVVTIPVN